MPTSESTYRRPSVEELSTTEDGPVVQTLNEAGEPIVRSASSGALAPERVYISRKGRTRRSVESY